MVFRMFAFEIFGSKNIFTFLSCSLLFDVERDRKHRERDGEHMQQGSQLKHTKARIINRWCLLSTCGYVYMNDTIIKTLLVLLSV